MKNLVLQEDRETSISLVLGVFNRTELGRPFSIKLVTLIPVMGSQVKTFSLPRLRRLMFGLVLGTFFVKNKEQKLENYSDLLVVEKRVGCRLIYLDSYLKNYSH